MNRRSFLTNTSALVAMAKVSIVMGAPTRYLVFIGTRTNAPGNGIYSFFFDATTGTCTSAILAAELASPTAFALSADNRHLYSTSELGNDGRSDGAISAFRIDAQAGRLTLLNKVPSNGGGPTFLALDFTGNTLVAACFGGGKANTFRVLSNGQLGDMISSMEDYGTGPLPRQTHPHAHCTLFAPGNKFVLTADLGADRVFVYRFNQSAGTLVPNDPPFYQAPPATGPRKMVFHPNGKFVYLVSEMAGTVTVFGWGAHEGTLIKLQRLSCNPGDMTGDRSSAGIVIRQDGSFLYTTTRTDSAIQVFAVDSSKGTLNLIQRLPSEGKVPWGCAIDSTGRLLATANLQSNSASIYGIEKRTGRVSSLVSAPGIPSPVSAVFLAV